MKRKPEELLKYLAYTLAKMGMVKEATKLAKSNGTGSEAEVLKELKDIVDKSVKACVAKKEVIEKLLNLQKDGKVSDKVGHLITKALMAPDAVFPQYLEKLEKAMVAPEPIIEIKKAGSKKNSPFEWKEGHDKQFGIGKAPYPFPKIADPDKVKGWKHVENHFVDSSGMGAEGEAALTHEQFHKLLKPGRGYAITDAGQFQVNIGAYEKEDKKNEVKKATYIDAVEGKHTDDPKIAEGTFNLKPKKKVEPKKEDKKNEVKKSSKNFEGLRNSVKESIKNGMDPRKAISTHIAGSQIDLGEHGKLMDEFVGKEDKKKK